MLGKTTSPFFVMPKMCPATHGRAARAQPPNLPPDQAYWGDPGAGVATPARPGWARLPSSWNCSWCCERGMIFTNLDPSQILANKLRHIICKDLGRVQISSHQREFGGGLAEHF